MSTELALVEPDEGSALGNLAACANHEHAQVLEAGASMIEHAIRAGEALLAAKTQCGDGSWTSWLQTQFAASHVTANVYMRVARYQDHVRASSIGSITGARDYLAAIEAPAARGRGELPHWMRDEAQRLVGDGLSARAVARELGIGHSTVRRWTDPDYLNHSRSRIAANSTRWHAERNKLRAERIAKERERALKCAARKAGGARAKAYALGESFHDVIAKAHREATDPQEREHWALATSHYHKMRDEIVRAFGVQ